MWPFLVLLSLLFMRSVVLQLLFLITLCHLSFLFAFSPLCLSLRTRGGWDGAGTHRPRFCTDMAKNVTKMIRFQAKIVYCTISCDQREKTVTLTCTFPLVILRNHHSPPPLLLLLLGANCNSSSSTLCSTVATVTVCCDSVRFVVAKCACGLDQKSAARVLGFRWRLTNADWAGNARQKWKNLINRLVPEPLQNLWYY